MELSDKVEGEPLKENPDHDPNYQDIVEKARRSYEEFQKAKAAKIKREKREARRKRKLEILQDRLAGYKQTTIEIQQNIADLEKEISLYTDPWGYYRKFHNGAPRKKLSRVCPPLYAIFRDRDELKFVPTKRRLFKTDADVMSYYDHCFKGYTGGQVWEADKIFHEVMRRRGLLVKIPPYSENPELAAKLKIPEKKAAETPKQSSN